MPDNSLTLLLGLLFAVVVALMVMGIFAYLKLRPIRANLPDELQDLLTSLATLGSQEKLLLERARPFLGVAQPPYDALVKSLKDDLASARQLRASFGPAALDIKNRFPAHSLVSLDSLWMKLQARTRVLQSEVERCRGLFAGVEQTLVKLEKVPAQQSDAVLALRNEFTATVAGFGQMVATAGMSGHIVADCSALEEQIRADFAQIVPALLQNGGDGATIPDTIRACELCASIRAKQDSLAAQFRTLRASYQALVELIETTETDLKMSAMLLRELQSKPMAITDSINDILEMRSAAGAIKQKIHPVNTDDIAELTEKSRSLKQNTAAALEQLRGWAASHQKFTELHPQLVQFIYRLKDRLEASPANIAWSESSQRLAQLQADFKSIPTPQSSLSGPKLEDHLAAAEALKTDVLALETRCQAAQTRADELFTILERLQQFFASPDFANMRQLVSDLDDHDPLNWDDVLAVRAYPADVQTSWQTFSALSVATPPIPDYSISDTSTRVLGLNKTVAGLTKRSVAIKTGLEALLKQKSASQQELKALLDLLNSDLLSFVNTPQNAAGEDTKTLLAEISKLKTINALIEQKAGKLSRKLDNFEQWKTEFLVTIRRLLVTIQSVAQKDYNALKQTRRDSRDILSRLSEEAVERADDISPVDTLVTANFEVLTPQTLAGLIDTYKKLVAYRLEVSRTLALVEKALKQIKPSYDQFALDLSAATSLWNQLSSRLDRTWPPCKTDATSLEKNWRIIQDQQNKLKVEKGSAQALGATYSALSVNVTTFAVYIKEKLDADDEYQGEFKELEAEITRKINRLPLTANPGAYREEAQDIKKKYDQQRKIDRRSAALSAKDSLDLLSQKVSQTAWERANPQSEDTASSAGKLSDSDRRYFCSQGYDILGKIIPYTNKVQNISSYQRSDAKKSLEEIRREFAANRLPNDVFIEMRFKNVKRNSSAMLDAVIEYLDEEQPSGVSALLKDLALKVRDSTR